MSGSCLGRLVFVSDDLLLQGVALLFISTSIGWLRRLRVPPLLEWLLQLPFVGPAVTDP